MTAVGDAGAAPGLAARLRGARWLAPLLLALCVLAPYHRLLVGSAVPIPDDIFVSDLADGELPLRVETGRIIRSGEPPLWTPGIWTGFPLYFVEPVSLALFTALPPALALGWYIALWLLAAALGTYALARRLGASRAGGFLAGFAFAWSGFIVCQLRHLGTITVVALFPAALLCLERATAGDAPPRRRLLWLAGFSALFGLQILGGFPQSAYNAALVYAALVAAHCVRILLPAAGGPGARTRATAAAGLAGGALAAALLGVLVGAVQLLPLWELGRLSDRSGGGTFEWATWYNYSPRNALTFLLPYANGDISNTTYRGRSIFWEDYGYVGLATVLLAVGAAASRLRRFAVSFWLGAGLLAYGLVLGRATPLYRIAFDVVPGMSTFRFPTRFLFVTELALALLGGIGLTALTELLDRRLGPRRRIVAPLVGLAFAAGTVADLVHHNRRQNPLVDADRWLARPASAAAILADGRGGRAFSPGGRDQHIRTFYRARGWSGDLGPYLAHREILQPDSNLLHGVDTVDGYGGIAPRWTVDLLGDHNRVGILGRLHGFTGNDLLASPAFFDLLEALSVRWVILPFRAGTPRLEHVASAPPAEVHRLPGTLPRARVVDRARIVPSAEALTPMLINGTIDLRRETVLHDPAAAGIVAGLAGSGGLAGEARIVVDRATEVAVEATSPRGGLLLLADTWYPGWEASVDGTPAPVLRANVGHRAVPLPPGSHRVEFRFRPRGVRVGFLVSAAGLLALTGATALLARRSRPAAAPTRP